MLITMNLIKHIYNKYPEELISVPPGEISIFHILSENNEEEMFIDLIEKFNIDINSIPPNEDESIIATICGNCNLKLMNYFSERGVVFDVVDTEGNTLLHHFCNRYYWFRDTDAFEKVKSTIYETLEFIVEKIYDENLDCFFVENEYGTTPIQNLAKFSQCFCLKLILKLYPELCGKIINLCVSEPERNGLLLKHMFIYYFGKK